MMPNSSVPQIPSVFALFWGALLAAAGYGATFLLTRHFGALGGSEIDTGAVLATAAIGTFVSLPVTASFSGRFGAARCAATGSGLVAVAFVVLAGSERANIMGLFGGFALGCGWGAFYLAAPMALSRLVQDAQRAYWFLRFGAFQMAGIGLSPVLGELVVTRVGMSARIYFLIVAASCGLASLLLLRFARQTRHLCRREQGTDLSWLRAIGAVLSGPSRAPVLMVALGAAAFGGAMTFQSSIVKGADLSPSTYFSVYTVTVVVARGLFASTINRLPPHVSIPALLTAMVIGLCLLFGTGAGVFAPAMHVTSAALFGLGYGLAYPLIQARAVNDVRDPALQTAALCWFVIFYFAGLFGFPFLGGWIVVRFGVDALIVTTVAAGGLELALSLGAARRAVTERRWGDQADKIKRRAQ